MITHKSHHAKDRLALTWSSQRIIFNSNIKIEIGKHLQGVYHNSSLLMKSSKGSTGSDLHEWTRFVTFYMHIKNASFRIVLNRFWTRNNYRINVDTEKKRYKVNRMRDGIWYWCVCVHTTTKRYDIYTNMYKEKSKFWKTKQTRDIYKSFHAFLIRITRCYVFLL